MMGRRATQIGLIAALLVGLGLAVGNAPLVVWGVVAGGVLAAGLSMDGPRDMVADIVPERTKVRVGDTFQIQVRMRVGRGIGPLLVRAPLPDSLQLAGGRNIALLWKGPRTSTHRFTFRVRAARRGPATLGGVIAHPLQPLRFGAVDPVPLVGPGTIFVEPRVRKVAHMRHIRGKAVTLLPAGDAARTGSRGNDFDEIRAYTLGDPLRNVNWKATARHSHDHLDLMVNEFAPEGKKSVWLFLDAGAHMEVGSTHENALDHALEGTLAVLSHFASRGYRLGATVFHQPQTRVFYPDVGNRQLRRLTEALATLTAHAGGEGLDTAVLRSRAFLLRERPLVLIVTRPEADPERTRAGLAQVRAVTGHGARTAPIVLLAPTPIAHTLEGGHHPLAAATLRLAARGTHQQLRRQGVRVLDWDPAGMPIERLLMREMVAR